MVDKKFSFNLGSRKLFPEERSVVEAVQKAVAASALKHGLAVKQGSAVFNATSKVMAAPSVKRHAGGMVAGGIAKAIETVDNPRRPSGIANAEKPWPGTTHKPGAHRAY